MGSDGKEAICDKVDKRINKVKRDGVCDFELASNTRNVLLPVDEASDVLSRKEKKRKEKKIPLESDVEEGKDYVATQANNEKEKNKIRKKRKLEHKEDEEISRNVVGEDNFNDGRKASEVILASSEEVISKKHKRSRVDKDICHDAGEPMEVMEAWNEEVIKKKHKKSVVDCDNCNDDGESMEVIQASNGKAGIGGEECDMLQKNIRKEASNDNELKATENKREHKKGKKRGKFEEASPQEEFQKNIEVRNAKGDKESKLSKSEEAFEMNNVREGNGRQEEKNKKVKKDGEVVYVSRVEGSTGEKESEKVKKSGRKTGDPEKLGHSKAEEAFEMKNVKEGNEKEMKKRVKKGKSGEEVGDVLVVEGKNGEKESKKIKMSRSKTVEGNPQELPVETEVGGLGARNRMRVAQTLETGFKGVLETTTDGKSTDCSNKSKLKRKSKRASWQEVDDLEKDYVRGKRFSKQEDEILKSAVFGYIKEHALGEDGLHKILHCKTYPEVKDCWKHIAEALPRRPPLSIYYRAHILFERGERRKWTEEEKEFIRNHYREHGADWKQMAADLSKHRFHVKDTWRRIKFANLKSGHWSQDEYQNLFDLVNMDLRMRAFEGKKSKYGMLRDNICWEAISEKLTTRTNAVCCLKWYGQLTSPMVDEGLWDDVDDYRLLVALYSLDASCIEDVEWDFLLEHRSGDVCRKRWGQMINHIGEHRNKSFSEQVEVLSKRYCPELLETREAYACQPIIP